MDKDIFHTILFAVGSLPFWTGERKLKQFLRGEAGSFWEDPKPLKPTYLNHHFFGGLSARDDGEITRGIQRLKRSDYLKKDRLSASLPHQVLKLTGKGVFKYYNVLVGDQNIETPTWWIHHISQLQRKPNQPITTGGEILEFTSDPHLTQTPGFVDQECRIKDEGTIRLAGDVDPLSDVDLSQSILLTNVVPNVKDGLMLVLGSPTEVRSIPSSDLRRKLTHFSPRESQPTDDNPYVLKGTLVDKSEVDGKTGTVELTLGRESNKISLQVPRQQLDPELHLETDNGYVVGPVKRMEGEENTLTLKSSGEIQPHEPYQ